ncbi:efflux RND transporter periplasmic adaptor subunit [Uliginosibacterium flavum]|uniref:Efflux RND transporter periplasmic adaptor subunit n=1 Tax=Uliginosibacterium flavum TaxID=1396831 RepID=A0ABV2TR87_9RHOO
MKNFLRTQGRRLAMVAVLLPLLALFAYAALRAGPLAPVPVTVASVARASITPALFGIGSVEARRTHKIGPTFVARLKRVEVQTGDRVKAGQLLGEMEPIDLDDKLGAQDAAVKRAEASVLTVEAQIQEVGARKTFTENQARRYEQLFAARNVSEEGVEAKRQDARAAQGALAATQANLAAARQELARLRAEREGLGRQRASLRLISPIDGLVTRRDADPGSTVVAGQAVIEIVEPGSLWIKARFDQLRAKGLQAGLPAQIALRAQAGQLLAGRVLYIEPYADPVTEELLAKLAFTPMPAAVPAIGELAEVTVMLAALPPLPVVSNASVQRVGGQLGVWLLTGEGLRFTPVTLGVADLEGRVQVTEGLQGGERVVVYSQKALSAQSRIKIVERLVGVAP